jgi:TRAP-type C4-dicarboxylate transport system permease small subunit
MLETADRLARVTSRTLAVCGLGLLLVYAVATIADGLLRFFFAAPIDAVPDLGGVVAAISIAGCLPLVLFERGNITIRLFSTFVSPRAGRIADVGAAILVEIVLFGMAWQFFRFARQEALDGNATWMLHVPIAPFGWVVDGALWVSVGIQALVSVQCFRESTGHRALRETPLER